VPQSRAVVTRRRHGDDEMIQAFGERLKQLRLDQNLSQEVLGELAGYQDRYISNLERAERQPTFTTLVRLATALGIEPSALLDGFVDAAVKARRDRSGS